MTPPAFPAGGLQAPDITGPTSILNWPISGPRAQRRRKQRPFAHVHIEVDLKPASLPPSTGLVGKVEKVLREREVVESPDLLRFTAGVLHAFSAAGFVRIRHWEAQPGGWLPLPEDRSGAREEEPLGHFLRIIVRRMHRERHHTVSIDLRGRFPEGVVDDLVGALRTRVPVRSTKVTEASYVPA
ncbi:MAG: hypothetical protein LVQ64_06365 [Thermoplasmatales archaeon]|nr:hypothetical protein [Thermoplasmatales archaeon]